MAKALSAAFAGLGLASAAAIALVAGGAGGPDGASSGAEAAGAIDGVLRETAAHVHERASTLAELPRLAAAVSTDQATVRDLSKEELAFSPRPDEAIVIGQLPNRGAPVVLLALPDGTAAAPALDRTGVQLLPAAGGLRLCEVVGVTPKDRADELRGALAVCWSIASGRLTAQLPSTLPALLSWPDSSLALTAAQPRDGAPMAEIPVGGALGLKASLRIEQPRAPGWTLPLPAAAGAAALALAGLVGAAISWRRKQDAAGSGQSAAVAGGWQSGTSQGDGPAAGGAPWSGSPPGGSRPGGSRPGGSRPGGSPPGGMAAAQRGGDPVSSGHSEAFPSLGRGASGLELALTVERRTIGRYEIVRPLGAGGMADVYLARATGEAGFEKLIALKVINRRLVVNRIVVDHFLDEARLASRLTHPNVVQISDLGRAGDEYFIAMEYVDGSDLERLIGRARARGAPVPPRVALAILRKICDGLHAAHIATDGDGKALEIVHRDIKSANVLLSREGAVKVSDFGVAKANQMLRSSKTEVGQVKGTAAYMAPEHRTGEPVDRRADLYGVGAIAYELFSGAPVNLDFLMLAQKGIEGWPHLTPLSELRPELPAELDEIVFRALRFEREERYADCAELEAALEAIAARHSGLAAGDKAIAAWVVDELTKRSAG